MKICGIYIYIYIYPNRAYFRDDKLSWRFYVFCVFSEGGQNLKIEKLQFIMTVQWFSEFSLNKLSWRFHDFLDVQCNKLSWRFFTIFFFFLLVFHFFLFLFLFLFFLASATSCPIGSLRFARGFKQKVLRYVALRLIWALCFARGFIKSACYLRGYFFSQDN